MAKRVLSGDSDEDSQQARPSVPKRARRQITPPEPAADVESSLLDSEPEEQEPRTQPQLDLDLLDERIRAKLEARREANIGKIGVAGQKGIIDSVEMVQFMCHKNLSFKFGNRFNFIIGHNGSGKSAVLTAITVALGGKANMTGRGNGIKSFIREGQNVAEVTITLKNEGYDAFKPSVFGKKIIITRRFTVQGASSYKICSEKKVLVSNKKAVLDDICDHMQIQVDNPLNVLTQDAARKFLGTTNPKDKYDFFLRGTILEQLEEEYEVIETNIKITSHILKRKAGDLPDLKQALDIAQKEYDEGLKIDGLRAKQTRLRVELAWAHCAEKEKELEDGFKAVADSDLRLEKLQSKVDESNKQVEQTSEDVQQLEARYDAIKDEAQEVKIRRNAIIQEVLAKRREIKAVKISENEMNVTLEEYKTTIANLSTQLELEATKLEHASQIQQDKYQARIDECKARIASLKTDKAPLVVQRDQLTKDIAAVERDEAQAKSELDTSQQKVQDIVDEISTINTQDGDRLAIFGANMAAILAEIKRGRWHGQEPVGPLGLYVELEDARKWGDIMRVSIGREMGAFGITDSRDSGPLRAILRHFKSFKTPIIISPYDIFDYDNGEPPAEFLTPLRVLKISNDYVRRLLINSSGIERNYLAINRIAAENLMDQRGHGVVLTSECYRVTRYLEDNGRKCEALPTVKFPDPRSKFFRETNNTARVRYERQPILVPERVLYSECVAIACSALQEDLQQARERVRQASGQLQRCRDNLQIMRRLLVDCKDNGRKLNTRLNKEELALEQVENEAREDAPVSIAALQDAKKENEDAKADLLRQFTDLQSSKIRLEHELGPLQDQASALLAEMNNSEDRRLLLSTQLEDLVVKREEALHAQRHYLAELEKDTKKRANFQSVTDTVQIEFQDWVAKASTIGEKVESTRSRDIIQREHDTLANGLKQRDRTQTKSLATLKAELLAKRQDLDAVKKNVHDFRALNYLLARSLALRQSRWEEWRAICAISCKNHFMLNMASRGYFGTLSFNHEDRTLDIKVKTDDQIAGSYASEKDPVSLSGGEKSFSTICLLLALWDTLGCPIRCLDEFDVFMDEVNRQISAKLLMDTARSTDGKQYILITPLNLNPRLIESWVTVHRMADPERRRADA